MICFNDGVSHESINIRLRMAQGIRLRMTQGMTLRM